MNFLFFNYNSDCEDVLGVCIVWRRTQNRDGIAGAQGLIFPLRPILTKTGNYLCVSGIYIAPSPRYSHTTHLCRGGTHNEPTPIQARPRTIAASARAGGGLPTSPAGFKQRDTDLRIYYRIFGFDSLKRPVKIKGFRVTSLGHKQLRKTA